MQAGSLSLQRIVYSQANFRVFGHNLRGLPFIVPQFVGFLLFVIATQAELTQTPFDMPVAESELVAGYMTEYSGFRFLLFFIGEFASAFGLAAIGATLFLGGWYFPGVSHFVHASWLRDLVGAGVLFAKLMVLAFVIFWVRFTFPRLREDQLQAFAWKFLIPVALLNILATGILKVAFHG
jgi:NADH-quinone oxidoreductase subunit H